MLAEAVLATDEVVACRAAWALTVDCRRVVEAMVVV